MNKKEVLNILSGFFFSEFGWTGKLWLNHIILILRKRRRLFLLIFFFLYLKKKKKKFEMFWDFKFFMTFF